MYDALSKMYEGSNTKTNMNAIDQLKGNNMRKGDFIQYYFTRVSQFREQLSAIGDTLDEDELVMTTLNGLTRP